MFEDDKKIPETKGESMVAERPVVAPAAKEKKSPAKKSAAPEEIRPVGELAQAAGIPLWETAALRQFAGWALGKQVTQTQFDAALFRLRNRRQGTGRI